MKIQRNSAKFLLLLNINAGLHVGVPDLNMKLYTHKIINTH